MPLVGRNGAARRGEGRGREGGRRLPPSPRLGTASWRSARGSAAFRRGAVRPSRGRRGSAERRLRGAPAAAPCPRRGSAAGPRETKAASARFVSGWRRRSPEGKLSAALRRATAPRGAPACHPVTAAAGRGRTKPPSRGPSRTAAERQPAPCRRAENSRGRTGPPDPAGDRLGYPAGAPGRAFYLGMRTRGSRRRRAAARGWVPGKDARAASRTWRCPRSRAGAQPVVRSVRGSPEAAAGLCCAFCSEFCRYNARCRLPKEPGTPLLTQILGVLFYKKKTTQLSTRRFTLRVTPSRRSLRSVTALPSSARSEFKLESPGRPCRRAAGAHAAQPGAAIRAVPGAAWPRPVHRPAGSDTDPRSPTRRHVPGPGPGSSLGARRNPRPSSRAPLRRRQLPRSALENFPCPPGSARGVPSSFGATPTSSAVSISNGAYRNMRLHTWCFYPLGNQQHLGVGINQLLDPLWLYLAKPGTAEDSETVFSF